MLTNEQLETAIALIQERYQKVTDNTMEMVGNQVKEIGQLSPTSINRLQQMNRLGKNVEQIEKELQKATGLSKREVKQLLKEACESEIQASQSLFEYRGITPNMEVFNRMVEAIYLQTEGLMENYSNTTALSESYQNLVSDSIQAVVNGTDDYQSKIRKGIKAFGNGGIKVVYESGYRRRLDTAIRQNIIDGTKQIQQEAQKLIGEQVGADGVELSAHPLSAPDHEDVQGRQFKISEYENMQSGFGCVDVDGNYYTGFARPIAEWNCRHFAFYIILGVAERQYTDEQLAKWRQQNRLGVEINGRHYSKYECTQIMRKYETEIRKAKDVANLAKASGDDVLRREQQKKINSLTDAYKKIADKANLELQLNRASVSGFRPVKVK